MILLSTLLFSCSDSKDEPDAFYTLQEVNNTIGKKYWKEADCKVVDKNGVEYTYSEASKWMADGAIPIRLFVLDNGMFRKFFQEDKLYFYDTEIEGMFQNTMKLLSSDLPEIRIISMSADRLEISYWHDTALCDMETSGQNIEESGQKGSYVRAVFVPASQDDIDPWLSAVPYRSL